MRVGIDIDGPLYDWHYCIYRYFQEFRSFAGTQREFWDYFRTLDNDTQSYYVSLPHLYLNMEMRPEVKKSVELLSGTAEIYYITARDESLKSVTRKFFDKSEMPFKENLIFSQSKVEYVRLLGLSYFLDDMPKHVKNLQGITEPYLLAVPHNYDQRDGFNIVYSVKEFVEIVRGSND